MPNRVETPVPEKVTGFPEMPEPDTVAVRELAPAPRLQLPTLVLAILGDHEEPRAERDDERVGNIVQGPNDVGEPRVLHLETNLHVRPKIGVEDHIQAERLRNFLVGLLDRVLDAEVPQLAFRFKLRGRLYPLKFAQLRFENGLVRRLFGVVFLNVDRIAPAWVDLLGGLRLARSRQRLRRRNAEAFRGADVG